MLALAVVALLVFGPDKLPGAANDAAKMVRRARGALRGTGGFLEESTGFTASQVRDQLEQLNQLRPQNIAQSLWSDEESDSAPRKPGPEAQPSQGPTAA